MTTLKIVLKRLKAICQIVCIKMSMPRPSGKAQKIAVDTIPGLSKYFLSSSRKTKSLPKDDVELKIVKINENRGKLYGEKRNRL